MKGKEPEMVPYYRPGTTEPEMVPKDSVEGVASQGYAPPAEEPELEPEPKAAPKKAAKKVAKHK